MNTLSTIAAIAWDPEIRGILITITGVAVLMGSVYLLLATNLGSRLGLLIALSALFGWMMLFALVWWLYGIGPVGDFPDWTVTEINVGDLDAAALEEARALPGPDDFPSAAAILEDPDVAALFDEGVEPSLGEIATVAPDAVADLDLGGWDLLSTAGRGESQAAADAALTDAATGLFATTGDYITIEAFELGGKPARQSDGVVDRVSNRLETTFTVTHPPHYSVVMVQPVVDAEVPAGAAPLAPEADESQPVVSVVMIRDIGSRRLPSAMIAFAFTILFAVSLYALHNRDKELMAARAAAEAG